VSGSDSRAGWPAAPPLSRRGRTLPGFATCEVSDEGKGSPDSLGDQAFDRFARGDESRTGRGNGLRLALVRAVAEAQGGSVAIGPGPGAVVVLRVPIA